MWLRNNKKYFSIEEKIKYYDNLKNSGTKEQKQIANKRLTELKKYKNKSKFSKVLLTQDTNFNSKETRNFKSRIVVIIGNKNNNAVVIPVKKANNIIALSKFDNNRFLHKNNIKTLIYNELFEKKDFDGTENDYLTNNEVNLLKSKFKL